MFASASIENARPGRPLQWPDPGEKQLTLDDAVRTRIAESTTLEQSTACLFELLFGGFAVWEDGRLIETRVFVAAVGPFRIVIHTREHGPPHFHVIAPGIDATFAIDDCSHLDGSVSGKHLHLIRYWHAEARPLLVRVWNESRPTDCPVGPIEL